MDKFAGLGLKNIFLVWLCCMVLSIVAKVIVTKYPIEGASQIILAGC